MSAQIIAILAVVLWGALVYQGENAMRWLYLMALFPIAVFGLFLMWLYAEASDRDFTFDLDERS